MSAIKLRPLGTRIIVRPGAGEWDEYKGSIIIPDSIKSKGRERPMKAEVLAVGPGMLMKNGERWPMPCKAGDVILFDKGAGEEIEIGGEKLRVIRDDNVMAIIEPTPTSWADPDPGCLKGPRE